MAKLPDSVGNFSKLRIKNSCLKEIKRISSRRDPARAKPSKN
jgi:hypothetical protein